MEIIIVVSIIAIYLIILVSLKINFQIEVKDNTIILTKLWKKIKIAPDDIISVSDASQFRKMYGMRLGKGIKTSTFKILLIHTTQGDFSIRKDDKDFQKIKKIIGKLEKEIPEK